MNNWKATAVDAHGEEVWWSIKNDLNFTQTKREVLAECEANGYTFKRLEQFK